MSCNDDVINLVITHEGTGLAQFRPNKKAKCSTNYSGSSTED